MLRLTIFREPFILDEQLRARAENTQQSYITREIDTFALSPKVANLFDDRGLVSRHKPVNKPVLEVFYDGCKDLSRQTG